MIKRVPRQRNVNDRFICNSSFTYANDMRLARQRTLKFAEVIMMLL